MNSQRRLGNVEGDFPFSFGTSSLVGGKIESQTKTKSDTAPVTKTEAPPTKTEAGPTKIEASKTTKVEASKTTKIEPLK